MRVSELNFEDLNVPIKPWSERKVKFYRETFELQVWCGNGSYWIDLELANSPGGVLDILTQLFKKDWVGPDLFYEIFEGINDAFREVFGGGMQGLLCPSGSNQRVNWQTGRKVPEKGKKRRYR